MRSGMAGGVERGIGCAGVVSPASCIVWAELEEYHLSIRPNIRFPQDCSGITRRHLSYCLHSPVPLKLICLVFSRFYLIKDFSYIAYAKGIRIGAYTCGRRTKAFVNNINSSCINTYVVMSALHSARQSISFRSSSGVKH